MKQTDNGHHSNETSSASSPQITWSRHARGDELIGRIDGQDGYWLSVRKSDEDDYRINVVRKGIGTNYPRSLGVCLPSVALALSWGDIVLDDVDGDLEALDRLDDLRINPGCITPSGRCQLRSAASAVNSYRSSLPPTSISSASTAREQAALILERRPDAPPQTPC